MTKLGAKSTRMNKRLIPVYILLVICTTKWFFEGMLDQPFFEVVFLIAASVIALTQSRGRIPAPALAWLLYIGNLIMSVALHSPTFGRMGRALLMCAMVALILFMDYGPELYADAYSFVIRLGVFYAAFVMLHFVLRATFTGLYFPLLESSSRYVANHYAARGYFFGLMFNPHEIAALISITIVALTLRQMVDRKAPIRQRILIAALFLPLFLTQKKGVLLISLAAFFIVLCVLYASRKQAIRIFGVALVLFVVIFALTRYIMSHSDHVVFYRLAKFINSISNGQAYDSGRARLYSAARQEFRSHPIFGIGWRMFNRTIRTAYGYESGHEVNNDYLQWLCETGIVGFAMNLIPVLMMLRRTLTLCFRYVRRLTDNNKKWVVLLAIYTQFFIVIYAYIEIPFYDNLCFGLYVLSCIVINGTYYEMRRSQPGRGGRRTAPAGLRS